MNELCNCSISREGIYALVMQRSPDATRLVNRIARSKAVEYEAQHHELQDQREDRHAEADGDVADDNRCDAVVGDLRWNADADEKRSARERGVREHALDVVDADPDIEAGTWSIGRGSDSMRRPMYCAGSRLRASTTLRSSVMVITDRPGSGMAPMTVCIASMLRPRSR